VAIEVVDQALVPIACEGDIIVVRRRAREIAQARGFDPFETAALTTATSELARNVWTHGHGGTAAIEELFDGARRGVRITFRDSGPGIEDIERVLVGGYSTARSLGLGLSGTKRLVDEFQLESVVGQGTVVTMVKWKRF